MYMGELGIIARLGVPHTPNVHKMQIIECTFQSPQFGEWDTRLRGGGIQKLFSRGVAIPTLDELTLHKSGQNHQILQSRWHLIYIW